MNEKPSIFHYGNIKHKAIVFIHGFPFDNYMWKGQVEYLSKEFFCINYDIRGLGNNAYGDFQFTLEDLVDDLEAVISASGVKRPFICGLSMGGYIALRAVERNEQNFSGLILCDTKSEADDNAAKLKRAEAIKRIEKEGAQKFVEEFVAPLFAAESIERLGEEFISILGRSMNFDPKGIKGCLLAMASRTDTSEYLSRINLPVLVLCGEKDILTPPEKMKQLASRIKNSRFHIIKKAGHLAPFERPEDVNKNILNFLKEIK